MNNNNLNNVNNSANGNNNMFFDRQTGFQFKNNGSKKAIGIFTIILMSVMGLSIAGAALCSEMPLGLIVLLLDAACTIPVVIVGIHLIKKDKEIDKRILASMHRYSRGELEWEIMNNLICIYENPHNLGKVYFTNRFIICTSQGVIPYEEITKIRAHRSTQKYGPYIYYLDVTDISGSEISVCRMDGDRNSAVTLYNEYIRLCAIKNSGFEVDIKHL